MDEEIVKQAMIQHMTEGLQFLTIEDLGELAQITIDFLKKKKGEIND